MSDELETVEPQVEEASTAAVEGAVEPTVEVELGALAAADPGPPATRASGTATPLVVEDLAPLLDVPLEVIVEIGRTQMSLRETLAIGPGSVVTLDKLVGEPADVLVNGRRVARGEIVAVDEEFGVRVTEIL